jgi:UDP-2-acetamido-3-amino-2,3-dideoxy-glucuronate N-acetyltransferase
MSYFAHESSYIDKDVKIGEGTKIWHFSHIMSGVVIGEHCILGQNVCIGPNVKIGKNVKIQNNVSVYEGVILEDNVFCGPSMVFTNVDTPRSAYPKKNSEYLKTLVKIGATIGANATIVCGVTLGKSCFIGAGSVITKNVPDYAIMYGVPGRLKGWMCECGRELDVAATEIVCSKCAQRYEFIDKDLLRKKEDI